VRFSLNIAHNAAGRDGFHSPASAPRAVRFSLNIAHNAAGRDGFHSPASAPCAVRFHSTSRTTQRAAMVFTHQRARPALCAPCCWSPPTRYHLLDMDRKIALRPASPEDEPFLFDLFRAVRAERFDFQPGGHPQMAVMVQLQFKAQEHASSLQYPCSKPSIIQLDGVAVGRLRVVHDDTGLQVADLAILPERQRKGIGTAVVKDVMAEARRTGLAIRSTVARANQAEIHFYRNLGFEVTDQDGAYVRMHWPPTRAV